MQSHGLGYIEILNPYSISESFKTEYYSAIVSYAIRSWITFIYEFFAKIKLKWQPKKKKIEKFKKISFILFNI